MRVGEKRDTQRNSHRLGRASSHILGIGICTSNILHLLKRQKLTRVQAVRLSRTHANLQLALVRRALTVALAPSHRPSAPALYALGILPAPSTRASASIAAAAHTLQRQLERDHVRRALLVARVGRSLGEVMQAHAGLWREGEAVRTALCPSIRGRKRFFEGLATPTATAAAAADLKR